MLDMLLYVLKVDSFGCIFCVEGLVGFFVCCDLCVILLWLWLLVWWLVCCEVCVLCYIYGMVDVLQLLVWNGYYFDCSFMVGDVMYQCLLCGDLVWFCVVCCLLQQLYWCGVVYNDLVKEVNWLVIEDGCLVLIDFQLVVIGNLCLCWMCLLVCEDLCYLFKYKCMYCCELFILVEKWVFKCILWVCELWFVIGKLVYCFVICCILYWEDNEGQGFKL